jgi:thiamine biosynthesis lipoprotein ApbE
MKMDRRSFLLLPVLAPLSVRGLGQPEEYAFQYDRIMGTSMDLAVWMPAGSEAAAQLAANAALDEIERLSRILSTYDPDSEIRQFERDGARIPSRELEHVLELYRFWQRRTGGVLSIRPRGPNSPLNVDALGKAYIIDRAAAEIRTAAPLLDGFVLNIGGDIVVWGRACELGIANPAEPHDNAEPLTRIVLQNEAVATSGIYARGLHFIDARTGLLAVAPASATVIAHDAVTANALATTLCIVNANEGFNLVERIPNAEALRIDPNGRAQRTSGFARRERFRRVRQTPSTTWPTGYEVAISVTLLTPDPRADRSYVAMWVEDPAGKLVRAIVLWGNKLQYHTELKDYWKITNGSKDIQYKVTRATRAPGSYRVVWNGLDDQGKPVPRGTYRIVIETNRWHGVYAKAVGTLACEGEPASVSTGGSENYEPIKIQYGPKPTQA